MSKFHMNEKFKAGQTSLMNKLVGKECPSDMDTTNGLDIITHNFQSGDGETSKNVTFYDFSSADQDKNMVRSELKEINLVLLCYPAFQQKNCKIIVDNESFENFIGDNLEFLGKENVATENIQVVFTKCGESFEDFKLNAEVLNYISKESLKKPIITSTRTIDGTKDLKEFICNYTPKQQVKVAEESNTKNKEKVVVKKKNTEVVDDGKNKQAPNVGKKKRISLFKSVWIKVKSIFKSIRDYFVGKYHKIFNNDQSQELKEIDAKTIVPLQDGENGAVIGVSYKLHDGGYCQVPHSYKLFRKILELKPKNSGDKIDNKNDGSELEEYSGYCQERKFLDDKNLPNNSQNQQENLLNQQNNENLVIEL